MLYYKRNDHLENSGVFRIFSHITLLLLCIHLVLHSFSTKLFKEGNQPAKLTQTKAILIESILVNVLLK